MKLFNEELNMCVQAEIGTDGNDAYKPINFMYENKNIRANLEEGFRPVLFCNFLCNFGLYVNEGIDVNMLLVSGSLSACTSNTSTE